MHNKKIFIFYLLGFLFNFTIFIILFNTNIGIETFFYKGLVIVFMTLFLQYCFLLIIKKYKFFFLSILHIHIICISAFCFTLLLHTLILTSLDRAISVYFISLMNYKENGLTQKEIKENFYKDYFEGDKAIERRIEEQLITGNIYQIDNKYYVTKRGKFTFHIFYNLSRIFNIKNNYLPIYNFNK